MYDQSYLDNLIKNQVEESLNLDYKASGALERIDKKTNEISKDVSAFANSDGGIIIYGIIEDSEDKHLPVEIDPINRDKISREWLEQIIHSKIRPRIAGIEIHPIEINGDKKSVVYLVEIPQSNTVHQAEDKRYYRRFNFISVPMYDYEIKDVMNRVKTPIINLEFEIIISSTKIQGTKNENKTNYNLSIYAKNDGKVLAQYVNCYISIPETCLEGKNSHFSPPKMIEYSADNTIRDVLDVELIGLAPRYKYGPSRYDPILPRLKMKLNCDIANLDQYYYDYGNEISWVVYADNAEPRNGKIKFGEIIKKYK